MARLSVQVRAADPSDAVGLALLVQASDTSSSTLSGRIAADADTDYLAQRFTDILADPSRSLLVALNDEHEPVGMLAARRDEIGAIDLTPVLHVTHLMVAPTNRRRGIGRALLTAAVQLAEDAGVDRVLATAAAGSREGNRYLARIGFAPLVVHRLATTATLRRSLGMADAAGRMAVLRRARVLRAQRAGFASRPLGRGA